MTQYHNLDDSGDPGLGGSATASTHLALAMVQLAERAPLTVLAALREELYLPSTFEFKYHAARPRQKALFFDAVRATPFRVRALVLDKSRVAGQFAGMRGQELIIELVTSLTLRASELDISNDVLVVDGATPAFCRALRIKFSSECSRLDRVRPFSKIVGSRSQHEDGLQLADMIAGAVRHYAMGVERSYFRTFDNKVADLWQIPEQ